MKRKEEKFIKVNNILDNIAHSLGIERGIKEITLLKYWEEFIDEKFKDKTKAVSVIKKGEYDSIMIAVSSSAVSQELFIRKRNILNKISPIAFSLGFKIKDIIFNTKIWNDYNTENNKEPEKITHYLVKNPTQEELKDIIVPESIINNIKDSLNKDDFNLPEIKERLLNTIIFDIKTQIWRKNNGFPSCSKCGITINYFSFEEDKLCPVCKLK